MPRGPEVDAEDVEDLVAGDRRGADGDRHGEAILPTNTGTALRPCPGHRLSFRPLLEARIAERCPLEIL